jgi:DNA-binding transcriptional regulator YiaG
MTIQEIRAATRLSQAAFGKLCGGIPIRTIQNWEGGINTPPAYVINLIIYKLTAEGYNVGEEKETNHE